ncbi:MULTISPECIES: DMT family transporter [unclassified Sphingomonas]|uniref:DMT family transporter n=1 Tax=Sphingomonas TaxID=13687 RepID=UPI0009651321|nr:MULTISPECIES: DMT family transporter [unclassified Sphingomonas]MBN8810966.1 DMT family transporter [Sphingomonas sp.]OJY54473.1 MAG: multidrug DMT transporter permease [Sphingomonas sp. 67-41]
MPGERGSTMLGVLCGAAAGALWGLVFLAPELARAFGPLELTIGRYLAYGLISAALIVPRWRTVSASIGGAEWRALFWLGLAGNTLYYILLASAVQLGGAAITALVIGFLPVVVTIVGSRAEGAVPLARLAPSLLLCGAGTACIGWQALFLPSARPVAAQLAGLLCALGALASWGAFAVGNNHMLARVRTVSSHDWSLLIGIATGAQSLLLIPLALLLGTRGHGAGEWVLFVAVSAGVAIFASIVGNALWNKMSRLLPLTLAGQMITFETLFALLYAFAWEHRGPTVAEALAFVLVVASVVSCVAAHRRPGMAKEIKASTGLRP